MRIDLKSVALMAGLVLLTGCGATDPVQPDQDLSLPPGYGIGVVVIDSLDPLNAITFHSTDNKDAPLLEIGHVDKGVTMKVYLLQAGTWCVTSFFYGVTLFKERDPDRDVCFDVLPGKVAYSGDIGPRAAGRNSANMLQHYEWAVFEKAFALGYPKLAKYPIVTP